VTRAGFGKVEISPSAIGAELMGYANRDGAATSVHDPLHVRALAIECGDRRVALCSVDLCAVNEDVVAAARARVERERGVPAEHVLVSATHTHSAPHDDDAACWPDGLDARIAAAVAQACDALTPARIGAAEEVLRVHRGVATGEVDGVWARRIAVAAAPSGEHDPGPLGGHGAPRAAPDEPVDVMLVGIDGPDVVLLGQPGEVFGETGVDLRRRLREAGVRHPFVLGYANGWRAYLAPRSAYRDGGYEVEWARAMRLPETLQDDIRALVAGALAE
jgi:hypothetical protein